MSILAQDFLENSASRLPDKIALVCDNQRLTYAQIDQKANRLANALLAHGLKRGDRVAIFLPNPIALVIGIFATLKAGGVFVVINPTTKEDKLAYILNNCGVGVAARRAGQSTHSRQRGTSRSALAFRRAARASCPTTVFCQRALFASAKHARCWPLGRRTRDEG